MRKDLIEELRQRHPLLLGPIGEPPIQPSILCGDGWFNLLDCLCGVVQASAATRGHGNIRVEEIKSKYGSLRALGDLDRCAGDGWVGTLVLTG